MRNLFRGYYHPTEEETATIWKDGIITLDTNILLSLYRVQPSTSDLYLKALEDRAEQMWCAYQVGAEFHRKVHEVRNSQTIDHTKRIKDVQNSISTLSNTKTQSHLQETRTQAEAVDALEKLAAELISEQQQIGNRNDPKKTDDLLGRIASIYKEKVGQAPNSEELTMLNETGQARFEKKLPPGYSDANKSGDRPYGDYIFWRQVMDHSKATGRDVILVTDDNKEDWWIKGGNDKKLSLAPRPELIQEFRAETGQEILIYNSQDFYALLTFKQIHDPADEKAIQDAAEDLSTVVRNQRDEDMLMDLKSELDNRAARRPIFEREYPPMLDPKIRQKFLVPEQALTGGLRNGTPHQRYIDHMRKEFDKTQRQLENLEGKRAWHSKVISEIQARISAFESALDSFDISAEGSETLQEMNSDLGEQLENLAENRHEASLLANKLERITNELALFLGPEEAS